VIPPHQTVTLETQVGTVRLRPEGPEDTDFLLAVFRAHAATDLGMLDARTLDGLARMQFNARAASYRAQYPDARHDIIETVGQGLGPESPGLRPWTPLGRLVLDIGAEAACIVDFALRPDATGRGLGVSILGSALARLVPPGRPTRCMVLAGNEASLRMCQRVGFRIVGDAPPFLRLERPGS